MWSLLIKKNEKSAKWWSVAYTRNGSIYVYISGSVKKINKKISLAEHKNWEILSINQHITKKPLTFEFDNNDS